MKNGGKQNVQGILASSQDEMTAHHAMDVGRKRLDPLLVARAGPKPSGSGTPLT